jgi:superoxide dismutase, Cu-Zn family
MAAGGHYDPANTGKHLGPLGEGHRGDLPALTVEPDGSATKVMIQVGGDNYSDHAFEKSTENATRLMRLKGLLHPL